MSNLSRREFIKLTALTAAATTLGACAQATPQPSEPPAATAAPQPTEAMAATEAPVATEAPAAAASTAGKYKEAPMLAELVNAGKLPPVDQRLPENPRVITPKEKVGTYGGTWHRAYKGVSDRWGPTKLMEEHALQWEWEGDAPKSVVNTVEKWEQNADASEFTFYMRKGMRWSDGEDFDTNDVKFWYEDVYLNQDLTPSYGNTYDNADKTPFELTVVDQYTFKVKYKSPKPLLSIILPKIGTNMPAGPDFAAPEHYMKQWHIKYGDKAAIDAKLKELKLTTWNELWCTGGNSGDWQGPMAFWFLNPDRPVINAWTLKAPPPSDPLVEERNPYFFKVDTDGNQLPYIDGIEHALFNDQQVLNLWLVSGKIDCQYRYTDVGAFTLYKENEAKGGYRVQKNIAASVSAFFPNINNPDPVLAELFDTPDFRHALSIAIDRQEINDLIYNGLLNPMQASPVHGSPNFDEEFTKVWAEYDPDTANSLLDGLGLTMGSDGKTRTRSDGKPLEIIIETQDTTGSQGLDECNQVKKYWDAIGVATSVKTVERSLYEQHCHDGSIDVGRWGADRQSIVMADPGRYLGTTDDGPWAPLYAHWYNKAPYKQVEPPADHPIRKIWEAWDQCQVEPDETKRNALFKSMLDIHKANPWIIGTVGEAPALWIVQNNFHNVPEGYIEDDTLRDAGVAEPWQFYMGQA